MRGAPVRSMFSLNAQNRRPARRQWSDVNKVIGNSEHSADPMAVVPSGTMSLVRACGHDDMRDKARGELTHGQHGTGRVMHHVHRRTTPEQARQTETTMCAHDN